MSDAQKRKEGGFGQKSVWEGGQKGKKLFVFFVAVFVANMLLLEMNYAILQW